jgi:hypothetical protein
MAPWNITLQVLPQHKTRLLVTDAENNDLLKAHLAGYPRHPRALLTTLEGLALWCGEPVTVVIYADVPVDHSLGLGSFADLDDGWPEDSPLVHFLFCEAGRRGRRIQGFGDFRRLRGRS